MTVLLPESKTELNSTQENMIKLKTFALSNKTIFSLSLLIFGKKNTVYHCLPEYLLIFFNTIIRCKSNVWKITYTHIWKDKLHSPVMLMVGCRSSVLCWEQGWFNLTGLEVGNYYWGITGGYFQKLFTPKCWLSDPDCWDHFIFFLYFLVSISCLFCHMTCSYESNESVPGWWK